MGWKEKTAPDTGWRRKGSTETPESQANHPMLRRTTRRPGKPAERLPVSDVTCHRQSPKAPKACPGKNPDRAGSWGASSAALGNRTPRPPQPAHPWGRVRGCALSLFWWTTARGDSSACDFSGPTRAEPLVSLTAGCRHAQKPEHENSRRKSDTGI